MPLTLAECAVGDQIILIDNKGHNGSMGAKIGATAIIVQICHPYIRVKWNRDALSGDQGDGGYYPKQFEKCAPKQVKVDYMKAVHEIVARG